MFKQKVYKKITTALALGLLLLVVAAPVSAASNQSGSSSSNTSGENISQAVTQSYNAGSAVQRGMIVMLKPGDPSSVVPLNQAGLKNMLGVIVAPNDSTVTLSPQTASQQQVYVATAGRYTTLVSNQNGAIHAGDYITVSAVSGIGMKADANQDIILGKAVASFNGTSNVQGTAAVKNDQGKSEQVAIGSVGVDLNISHNPLASKATDYIPSFLSKAAVTIASHPISAARIYLSLVLLLLSAGVTANIVYSGVRSGMMAIGRNPLSKKSIIRSLVQTVIAGLIIFIVGIFAVYLLLKL